MRHERPPRTLTLTHFANFVLGALMVATFGLGSPAADAQTTAAAAPSIAGDAVRCRSAADGLIRTTTYLP